MPHRNPFRSWLPLLAALACCPAAPALAAPQLYTFDFLSCDFDPDCAAPTRIAKFTTIGEALIAPPLPFSGSFESSPQEIEVATVLAGSWTAVYLKSYRNIFDTVGSYFVFTGLQAANGIAYVDDPIHAVGIDGYFAGPTTNPLIWQPGTYTGLVAFQCNYGVDCVSTPGAEDTVILQVTAQALVPEPASAALLAAGLLGLAARRRLSAAPAAG